MLLALITAVLAGMPAAYELDFGALPPANTGPFRDFIITLSFKGEPDVRMPFGYASKYTPKEVADGFMESMNDPRWKIKRDGERITIYGYDDVRIQNLTVQGKGPQPLWRRVIALPPEKKK